MKNFNFTNLIGIHKQVKGMNELGETTYKWMEVTKAWADVRTLKGTEYYTAANQIEHIAPIRFIIRYVPGLDVNTRVEYEGQLYDVESLMNDDGRNKTITIFARTRN